MIPKEVTALCVVLLGDDRDALGSLEDSVQAIVGRYNDWDNDRNQQGIRKLELQLDEVRSREAKARGKLRDIREIETRRHHLRFGNYEGTARAIAQRVREEEPRYSWVGVSPDEEDEPPLTDAEVTELLDLLWQIDQNREEELEKAVIHPEHLVSPDHFSNPNCTDFKLDFRF
jgi:hypothetical protein